MALRSLSEEEGSHLIRVKVALLVAAVGVQAVLFSSTAAPSYALSNGSGAGISMHGFDTCQDPSQRTEIGRAHV